MKKIIIALLILQTICLQNLSAQTDVTKKDTVVAIPVPAPKEEVKKKWYDNIGIRGYAQVRYNRLLETNDKLQCEQCDKSWGGDGGFFLRRMRVIIFGQVSKRVYVYIQPDFASSVSATSLHFGQLRDAYFDLGIDKENVFRFRIGQSKIPFGFENLQSSQNRLPLDRGDALNSAISNERDLGVFFYYAPKKIRERFAMLVRDGLKGSGDYGVFGFGAFNGQTANKPDLNKEAHLVARVSCPIVIGSQIIEPGIQGYSGRYVMPADLLTAGVKTNSNSSYMDQRAAASLIVYPKPFGIQAEYNIGRGPEFNKVTDSIEVQKLQGGYVMINSKLDFGKQTILPFVRYDYYDGGKKHEKDARSYTVRELEFGAEWQPGKNFELVAMYVISDRRFEDFKLQNNRQYGQLLRLQAQLNF